MNKCINCKYCRSYLHSVRKSFICNHPNYEYIHEYYREHKIKSMPGFIGFGDKFADVPKRKLTPKWCPNEIVISTYENIESRR